MTTRFSQFPSDYSMPKWGLLFHAGTAWFDAWRILKQDRETASSHMFYVEPWALAFSLELFVKSLASHHDPNTSMRGFGHSVGGLIRKYADGIDVFRRISKNAELMALIEEYERTRDTRYGETSVTLDSDDEDKVVQAIQEIRSEMCRRTGLR